MEWIHYHVSSSGTSPVDLTKFVRGRYERAPKRLKLPVSSTVILRINLCVVKSCRMKISKNMEVRLPLKLRESSGSKENLMKVSMLRSLSRNFLLRGWKVIDGDIAYWKAGA